MPTSSLRFPAARVLLAAAALLGSAAARAGVERSVEATATGARVTVSWTAAPSGIGSALVVRESLPAGVSVSVPSVGAAGSALSAVRREGAVWAFLVPRASAAGAGSFSYDIAFESASSLPVSGVWRGMKSAGAAVSGAVSGASALPGRGGSGPGAESGVVPGEFSIRAFSVEPAGGATRATFSWAGSGSAPVRIQWAPSLGAAAPAAKGAADSGWRTLATVVPGETSGLASERVRKSVPGPAKDAASAAEQEETVWSYSVETDAPAGFFRLVAPDSGNGK